MRAWAGPTTIAAGAALAVWLSFGTLAVSEPSAGARIGVPAPLWQLGLLIALIVPLAVAAVRRRVRLAPLAACVVLLLPWLPVRLPAAALVWTGPMAVVLLLLVATSMAALWFDEHPETGSRARLLAIAAHPRQAPALAALLAFILYLAAAYQVRAVRPGGDEPHYLIITQSLLQDGDLKIENNHDTRSILKPDFLRRGANGAIYSVHAPGLPALVAPAYAIAGYRGVVFFLALLAALASALAWRLALLVAGSASAAWFAWAAVALSPPFFFLTGAIYPDGPAAACALVVVWVLLTTERAMSRGEPSGLPGRAACLFGGIALGFLPWLHSRYAATAALLGAVAAWLLLRFPVGRDRAIALLAPAVASAVAWFTFFYLVYGTPDPSAPYGGYLQTGVSLLGTGVPGLLFDQQFGLLCFAPVLTVAVVGWARLARMRDYRWSAIAVLAAVVLPLLLGGAYRMWWGGFSSAGRFAVPGVLVMAVPIAIAWNTCRTATGRTLALLALVVSLGLTGLLGLALGGGLVYNVRDGYATWLRWLNDLVQLPFGLPSYIRDPRATALVQTAVWLGLLVLAWGALRIVERRISRAATIALAPVAIALAIMLALSHTWWLTGDEPLNPSLSQADMLEAQRDRTVPGLLDFRTWRWLSGDAALARIEIVSHTNRGRVGLLATYFAVQRLAAGEYRVRSQRLAPANLDVHVSRPFGRSGPLPFATLRFEASAGAPLATFTLPVDVVDLRITGDDRAMALGQLSIQPVRFNRARASLSAATQAARYGEAAVFFFDRAAYPEREGFWVQAAATSQFVVHTPQVSPSVPLFLRNGALPNHVTVRALGMSESISMDAREERMLAVPTGGRDAIRVDVTSEGGFRPSRFDPKSTDFRDLGVWVEVR